MQPKWLKGRQFEETFENAQWTTIKQVRPVWLCINPCWHFEETFENAHWRKIKQLRRVWLCINPCWHFEETFENTQWRKVKQVKPVWFQTWGKVELMRPMWLCKNQTSDQCDFALIHQFRLTEETFKKMEKSWNVSKYCHWYFQLCHIRFVHYKILVFITICHTSRMLLVIMCIFR